MKNPDGYRSEETEDAEDAFLKQRYRTLGVAGLVSGPSALLVIDEADQLKTPGSLSAALLPHWLRSRVPCVAGERNSAAARAPLDATRRQTARDTVDSIAAVSIFRITGGNFRLLNRLLTQIAPILEINAMPVVTKDVVEAARENLVIGQS